MNSPKEILNSVISENLPEMTTCSHPKFNKEKNNSPNCLYCGLFLPKNNTKTFSPKKPSNTPIFVTMKSLLKSYQKPSKYNISLEDFPKMYLESREKIIDLVISKANILEFSKLTLNLAILYMDITMNQQDPNQNFTFRQLEMLAIICLFLAAKAIELDKKIPFINELKKTCQIEYSKDVMKKFELKILDLLNWDLILPSFYEIFQFFCAQGIVFSNDKYETQAKVFEEVTRKNNFLMKSCPEAFSVEVNENSTEIEENLEEIYKNLEEKTPILLELILKDINLTLNNPIKLAYACIAYLRKISGINPWNSNLNEITGISRLDVLDIFAELEEKFDSKFNQKFNQLEENLKNFSAVYEKRNNFIHILHC